jgi:hypothetical protein
MWHWYLAFAINNLNLVFVYVLLIWLSCCALRMPCSSDSQTRLFPGWHLKAERSSVRLLSYSSLNGRMDHDRPNLNAGHTLSRKPILLIASTGWGKTAAFFVLILVLRHILTHPRPIRFIQCIKNLLYFHWSTLCRSSACRQRWHMLHLGVKELH